jgi:hypothetical protein
VAANPDDNILDNIYKSLKDGGCSYIEWTFSPLQNTSFIKEKLGKFGFRGTRIYLRRNLDCIDRHSSWIPIDTATVLKHILSARAKDKSQPFKKHLAFIFQNLLLRFMPGLFMSYPALTGSRIEKVTICSVSEKPGPGAELDRTANDLSSGCSELSVNGFQSLIRQTLDTLSFNGSQADRSEKTNIYLSNKNTSTDQVLLYVFKDRAPKPYFFIKVSRSEESTPAMRAEFDNLIYIQEKTMGCYDIPKALFSLDIGGQTALGESYVGGTPLDSIIRKDNYTDICWKVSGSSISESKPKYQPTMKLGTD